ncbi:DNA-processing protein DprA [Clostridium oceanicum]|uniref:DNA-processing protein DprA n=1 Tax=Clostridium oceanicum TaxID=1543 RepID=A0ABP3UJZ1_9CLOT
MELNLWYSSAKIPNSIKVQLLKNYKSLNNIFKIIFDNPIKTPDNLLNSKVVNLLKKAWDVDKIKKLKEKALDKDVNVVNFNDDLYPKKLKSYEDSPSVLFYRGNIKALENTKSAGIVGSRNCTVYGIKAAKLISEILTKNNISIISGMARGIDYYGHINCIKNNGFTCAVLGCGIDIVYPKENKKLYDILCNDGCIVSEFLLGTPPYAYNFPRRNRIISGLSDILIVVEAGKKSGSLITAGLALEQGKDVLVVPGSIFSGQSIGANKLIKDGAYVFTEEKDLFDLLNIEEYSFMKKDKEKKYNDKSIEGKIFKYINDNPIHIDDIIRLVNIDIKQLYEVLFELQLREQIICLPGNYYVKS